MKMTSQTMLNRFSQKTISMAEHTKQLDLRPYNNLIYDWEIEYKGYWRGEDDIPEGFVDFHVYVDITEALVTARDKKTHKKLKRPGYKLTVTQNHAFPEMGWESYVVYDEEFKKDQLDKAFDAFQRELLNIQGWIIIAESRAKLIPEGKDVFECMHCGWVTDQLKDDITCIGCGKRYWSYNLLNKATCSQASESKSALQINR